MSRIRVNNLRKVYDVPGGEEIAVDNVNLDISNTDFLTLLGPSGCGKTTTLRCIAGLETPTEGTVYYDDDDVTPKLAQERDISMVFQEIALYPHMKCIDNIAYPLKVRGVSKDERHERAREVAEILEVGGLVKKHPAELSGGQRQRIAIARAIVREPRAFLMDEPMTGLDEKLKVVMRKELKRVVNETNQTVVYVTHSQQEAMMLSDHIAVMNEGQIEQVGSPNEVYSEPNNRFVATFVGMPEMNIWDARVAGDSIKVDLGGGQRIEFSPRDDASDSSRKRKTAWSSRSGSDIDIGFRPQALSLVQREQGDINAELRLVEPMGENDLCYLDVGNLEIRVLASDASGVEEHTTVGIDIDRQSGYVFDGELGSTIARTGGATEVEARNTAADYATTDD
ncbi:ABC transporter ATP-binding protein [Haloquadratum walsbyi]|jgi:multiple sugar transport system ATP-binding protein|uniref:ABC-type D-xylose/L-arabinose transporter n=1 Tax=Haloquadratum walsbyi (strain DSM 16790 / HBSQ001) TaxID=362976 RepID=Q18IQ2_HALWD|nr:ABC transporter ATP-binding protein [Haloquadratum walsbyi]CAJ52117.1 ABC-type transport system ATP-binding protein (probable substrate sugar) [Haloquadratum walsbyi DSM 16790]